MGKRSRQTALFGPAEDRLTFLRRQLFETEADIAGLAGVARVQARRLALAISADVAALEAERAAAADVAVGRDLTDAELIAELVDELARMAPEHLEALHRATSALLGLADALPPPALEIVG